MLIARATVLGRMCAHPDLTSEPREEMITTTGTKKRAQRSMGTLGRKEIVVAAEMKNEETKSMLQNPIVLQLLMFSKTQTGQV
jgi:hypothetical protein